MKFTQVRAKRISSGRTTDNLLKPEIWREVKAEGSKLKVERIGG
jgi:hypothetical protein